MFGKIKSEFPCFKGEGQNSNVSRDKTRNPLFVRSVWKDKVRILMLGRISSEFQCLDRQGQNSNDWKDENTILMLREIRPEFQCFEG